MTKRQDLNLQRRSRPEQSDQRQPDQAANISHQPRASPDSTSLASRIEFPTMTSRARLASATSRSCRAFLIDSVQAGPRLLPRSFEGLVSLRIQTQKVSLFGLHITLGT